MGECRRMWNLWRIWGWTRTNSLYRGVAYFQVKQFFLRKHELCLVWLSLDYCAEKIYVDRMCGSETLEDAL